MRPTEGQYLKIRNHFYKNYPEDMISLDEFRKLISPFKSDNNFCIVSEDNKGIYLNWIYVHESNRKKGIGKRIYSKLVEWAKIRGHKEISLHIRLTNYPSLVAAIKSGATLTGPTMYADGEPGYELTFYTEKIINI